MIDFGSDLGDPYVTDGMAMASKVALGGLLSAEDHHHLRDRFDNAFTAAFARDIPLTKQWNLQ